MHVYMIPVLYLIAGHVMIMSTANPQTFEIVN